MKRFLLSIILLPSYFTLNSFTQNRLNDLSAGRQESKNLATLKVYNVIGRKVKTLFNEELIAGEHEVNFGGNGLTSGIFLFQLEVESFIETKKIILMK